MTSSRAGEKTLDGLAADGFTPDRLPVVVVGVTEVTPGDGGVKSGGVLDSGARAGESG